jgi:hypothetical protein
MNIILTRYKNMACIIEFQFLIALAYIVDKKWGISGNVHCNTNIPPNTGTHTHSQQEAKTHIINFASQKQRGNNKQQQHVYVLRYYYTSM